MELLRGLSAHIKDWSGMGLGWESDGAGAKNCPSTVQFTSIQHQRPPVVPPPTMTQGLSHDRNENGHEQYAIYSEESLGGLGGSGNDP